jgi:hypothetical protein
VDEGNAHRGTHEELERIQIRGGTPGVWMGEKEKRRR